MTPLNKVVRGTDMILTESCINISLMYTSGVVHTYRQT